MALMLAHRLGHCPNIKTLSAQNFVFPVKVLSKYIYCFNQLEIFN